LIQIEFSQYLLDLIYGGGEQNTTKDLNETSSLLLERPQNYTIEGKLKKQMENSHFS
jgi:hypothetical protein